MYDEREKGIHKSTMCQIDIGTERKIKRRREKDNGKGNTAAKRWRNIGTETKRKRNEGTQR